jgi:hypothetical protein
MAVTEFPLVTFRDIGTAASYVTSSITPTANRLVLAAVGSDKGSSGAVSPTLSGCGLTWVLVAEVGTGGPAFVLSVFRALGTPSAGAVTIDYGGVNQASCWWSINEFDGEDLTGTNGSGAVVQSVTNTGTTTSLTVTLAAFGSANNATYGAFFLIYASGTGTIAGGSGFTLIDQVHDDPHGDSLGTEWRSDNSTTVDASWTGAVAPIFSRSPLTLLTSDQVEAYLLVHVGARPADRDPVDARIINDVITLQGNSLLTNESQVGGFPTLAQNTRVLSIPSNYTDILPSGYTILEEDVLFPLAGVVEGGFLTLPRPYAHRAPA